MAKVSETPPIPHIGSGIRVPKLKHQWRLRLIDVIGSQAVTEILWEHLRSDLRETDASRAACALGMIENLCSQPFQPPRVEAGDRATGDEKGERITLKTKTVPSEPPRGNQARPRTDHGVEDHGFRRRGLFDEVLCYRHRHPRRERMKPGGLGTLFLCSESPELRKCRLHSSIVVRPASHRGPGLFAIGSPISTE